MATGSAVVYKTRGSIDEYQLIAQDAAVVWAQTRWIDLTDAKTKKHVKRLLHQIAGAEQTSQLKVEIYYTNKITEDGTLGKSTLVNSANPIKCFPSIPSCRYLKIKFIDERVDYNWEIFGFELWGTLTSKRF